MNWQALYSVAMAVLPRFAFIVALLISASHAQSPSRQTITIAGGVPLHVRVTHTARLRLGEPVEGILTQPVYVRDRLILPSGALLRGKVTAYAPVPRTERTQALLNGDITPLHAPIVAFTTLRLPQPAEDVALDSSAEIRDTQVVRFLPRTKKPSLYQQARDAVKQRIDDTRETLFGPNKKDRALRFLYSQLPYHPQRIWVGTQFVADLNSTAAVDLPFAPPAAFSDDPSLDGIRVSARLADTIDSKGARKGDNVSAVVTTPVFNADRKLILPEGATLSGIVTQSRPARSFGRNGTLRFSIRGVENPGRPAQAVYGTLTAAEGNSGANITVDDEGNVKANPDKDRFLAPLLLAVTAAMGHDDDHHHDGGTGDNVGGTTVASNGFGLVARVIALTVSNQSVATGFGTYALAKSIYFRFLARGHEVSFPKDTMVEVQLAQREPNSSSAHP